MKGNYGGGDASTHGKGGLSAAAGRNPNKHAMLNDAPEGPFSHLMGGSGDGGMHGDTSVSGKNGETFHFK